MKTYNLTFFLPAVFALTFLALATLLSTIEYLQNRSEIFNQASQNLHDSGLQLAHTIEYARANNAQEQIRSAMRQFVLRDSAEFSALVDEHYQVIYSSQEHWHNLSALDALPDTASLFLTEKTDDFRARDHRQDSAILVSIPVITYGIDTLDSGHGRWQLILQDDISGRLQTARHQTMMRTLPMLAVALLLLLMTYSVMRKLVIDPLRVLESMAHQLKQGQLKLSNPLTGDTAQQQLAETLVETGAQLEQQILQIREKEQRLSITLDSIGDAVIVTDKEGKVIRMNSKAEQMTGWQQQDAYGQALPQVFDIANASSGETISNPVEQVFATGNVVELANHTLLKSRTGQTYHISDSAAPIRDKWLENGSIQGVILVFQDVTTQYALREKLRETAEFLQNLMRISPSVTYVFDIVDDASNPFRLSYVSESVKNHSGLDSDYWLSDQAVWTEHLSADELDELQKALNRLRKNGGSEAHELRYRHRDGHYVTVQNHMVAVENQKGEIDKIICNSVDVSAQKKAQANSVWLGDILERSLNEIYVFDSKTLMFTLVNKGARENLGYSQEELACLTPLDLKHEFTEREFKQMIEPLLTGLKPRLRFETFHYRKDGTRYPVRVDLQLDNRGEQARFVALVEDTSEIQQQQEELQEERSLLRRIIDSSPDLIFCKDTNGVFIRCNKAFENYFGHPESEIIGKTDADFVDKDTAELFVRNDQLALQKNHSHINQEWIRYPDGRSALLETLKTPLRSPSGEIVGLLGISRDITLQRQAEQEQQLAAMVFRCGQEAVMITDANNNIIKVNPAFSSCTGYDEKEVLGKNPRILSSGAQDAAFYEMMWQSLKQNNVWSGEIWNRRKNGDIYLQWLSISMVHDSHGKLINHVAIMSDITKFREAENTISFLAQHDALTRLPNRSMLKDRVRQAMISAERHGQKLALMYLDLDRFKYINDSLGHAVGDDLLIAVANRMTELVREEDTVCRTGGDEFIVLLPDTDAQGAAHVAEKLINAINQPFTIRDNQLFISVSVGISIYPDNGRDAESLNKHADTAMYRAKQAGRNQYQFFTEEMHLQIVHRLELEHALRNALQEQQLFLVYQPQFDLNTQSISGCEALIRWQHPEYGLVSPDEFISVAEETGMINPIGTWVLEQAIAQCRQWLDDGHQDIFVAVNLSAVQFNNLQLVDDICEILHRYQLPARHLELEITESVAMMDIELTIQQLRAVKKHGIGLSLDDFGTGYSSLSYLKQFPINMLKIDKSFVLDMLADPDDAAIVDAIITLAKSLDLKTLAEGVETAEHLDLLKRKGCDFAQGYHLSRPVNAETITQLLATNKKARHTEDTTTGSGAEL